MTLDNQQNLVVISHYDQRPIEPLISLLDQIAEIDAGANYDLVVIVNAMSKELLKLPERHADLKILYRENQGFNIGAWQHGWLAAPNYDFYLFLQDECEIRRPNWLGASKRAAKPPKVGFVGECMNHISSWEVFEREYPEIFKECVSIAARNSFDIADNPDHLQMLSIGAERAALEKTGGFIEANTKVRAMAGEVLTSVRARMLGFRVRQTAWRPFEYIGHPQWSDLRHRSKSLHWSLSRAMHLWSPASLNRMIPRRRGPKRQPNSAIF